jgi:hypothetical protein
MRSLAKMQMELHYVYEAYKKFMNDNVFGEGEEEVHPNGEEQNKFAKKLDADFAAAKVKEKAKGKAKVERENTADSADGPSGRSEEDEN